MGYYMRYVCTDQRPVSPTDVQNALSAAGAGYSVQVDDTAATVCHAGATIAHVEINVPGDGLFDDERSELMEFATAASGDALGTARVLATLEGARAIVAAQILFGTGDTETTLSRLDPLWAWLFRNRDGLLQADGEGYYDAHGPVLQVA